LKYAFIVLNGSQIEWLSPRRFNVKIKYDVEVLERYVQETPDGKRIKRKIVRTSRSGQAEITDGLSIFCEDETIESMLDE
jgi:hypothetical protein